jgi:hypothetical protein
MEGAMSAATFTFAKCQRSPKAVDRPFPDSDECREVVGSKCIQWFWIRWKDSMEIQKSSGYLGASDFSRLMREKGEGFATLRSCYNT